MTTMIETYLNTLSEEILTLDIIDKGIKSLPDLTRFKNLEILNCSNNQLTSLSNLPQNLKILYCYHNQLTSLSNLPQNLKNLDCSNNQLTFLYNLPQNLEILNYSNNQLTLLPTLPQNLKILNCTNNQLTSLSNLPQNLEILYCHNNKLSSLSNLPQNLEILYCTNNQLTLLPILPQNLKILNCINNPFYKIVKGDTLIKTKQNIRTLNNFCDLYYCLKFKKQFRKWLWEKVREPNIKKLYNPIYLVENLQKDDDLDTVLYNWINK
jgi:Leucine-rich repeat (LRR) protein